MQYEVRAEAHVRLESWWVLLFLALIPVLHRLWTRSNRPARVLFSLPVPKTAALRISPHVWLLFLRYTALIFLIYALARPQDSFKEHERTVSGVDIMLVLDVSPSMSAEDLADRSRLDVAKDVIQSFIEGRQNDRIGLVIFSGEPLTSAPPTLDYSLVLKELRSAEMGVLREGTAIGDGLSLGIGRLKDSTARSKVVVLLTDGDNNWGRVAPLTAGELAAGYGIKVYTIAVGREGRVRIPILRRDVFGRTVKQYQYQDNSLNTELLEKIAEDTHGKFYRVSDEKTLDQVFKEIDGMEKTEIKSHEKLRFEERFQNALKWGLMLLLIERLLALGWWRVVP